MKNYIILGALSVFAACNQPATKIAAAVEYDDAWQLQTLLIKAKDKPRSLEAQHDVTFVIPDDWAGAPVTFEMWGLVGDANKKAYAKVDVTPVLDDTVDATLSLKLLDCSTPCTVGTVRCDGDAGVAMCLAVEGCGVWSQPVACPSATPFCSAGTCAATCTDECTMGTVQCDGTGATKTCGQADADACLDWKDPVACPAAQTCSGAGVCSSNCTDDCTAGATRCDGTTGVQTCGQADADSCLEWQPSTACPAMQACSANACRPVMTCANPVPNWKKESPATVPPARTSHTMAYDAAHNKVVMFGGGGDVSYLSDTWSWDGINWKPEMPTTIPPARSLHAMAHDAGHNKVVMFGGSNGAYLNDTWTWDGSNWKRETPATSPPVREGSALAHDGRNVVLFGGESTTTYDDTWTWDGVNWKSETPSTVPPFRSRHAVAYDATRNNVMMFGGYNGSYRDDTWTWDGVNWKPAMPSAAPSGRSRAAMAYDVTRSKVVLFGGSSASIFSDTWTWNGSNWKAESPATAPPVRRGAAMAYDAARNKIVMFGGFGGENLNDTWTLDWTCP
jgi:hypothetical protein